MCRAALLYIDKSPVKEIQNIGDTVFPWAALQAATHVI